MILSKIIKTKFTSVKECFNPDNGESIILPNGFGIYSELEKINKNSDINCPIFTCMVKDGYRMFNNNGKINSQYFKLYEKYLYFTANIFRSYLYNLNVLRNLPFLPTPSYRGMGFLEESESPTVFFSMTSNSKSGLISNSLGMDKSNITKMMNFMIKYKFLELHSEQHSYIDYEKGETPSDRKCRLFLVSKQFYRYPVKYFFKNDLIKKSLKESIDKEFEDIFKSVDDTINFETRILDDANISSYTFPTVEKLQRVAERMVIEEEKDKFGRIYSFGIPKEWYSEDNGKVITKKKSNGETYSYTINGKLKPNCPYVDINSHIYNYIIMMHGRKVLRKRKKYYDIEGNVYYDRFYSFLSMIPKWIRNEILIDEEEIVDCDATALHPRIIGKLFETYTKEKRPEFLKGDSHSKIADILNISRQEAKLINLSYWNSPIIDDCTISSKKNKEVFELMDDLIKKDYPKLFSYLKTVKCYTKSIKKRKSSHSNMSVYLMDSESRIMQEFFNTVSNLSFIYCYDSVSVKKSDLIFIKNSFEGVINWYLK